MKGFLHRSLIVLLAGTACLSCDHFETKKISSEQYFTQEWETLNVNEVDGYPMFDSCADVSEGPALKACFEETLTETFYEALSEHDFIVLEPIHDTLYISFTVDEKGSSSIEELEISNEIRNEIPQLETWIYGALEYLPEVKPATKMGIPVKTRFKIPLVLEVE